MPGSNLSNLGVPGELRTAGVGLEAALLDDLGLGVLAMDKDGYIVLWNRAAEEVFGWRAEEICGRNTLSALVTPEFRAKAAAILQRLANGESWRGVLAMKDRIGSTMRLRMSFNPVRDREGTVIAISGTWPARRADAAGRAKLGAIETPPFWSSIFGRLGAAAPAPGQQPGSGRLLRELGSAGLLLALALLGRTVLDQSLADQMPFVTFFPAVVVAGYVCRPWLAIALIMAFTAIGALWHPPNGAAVGLVSAAVFGVMALFAVIPSFYLAYARYAVQEKDEKLSLLNRELKHRLKNICAVIGSICQQTLRSAASKEYIAAAIAGRIRAIAEAQDLIGAGPDEGSRLRLLAEAVVGPLCPDRSRLELVGPDVALPAEATTGLALVLHELATNALKYGAWSAEKGQVAISWRLEAGRRLQLEWLERDGPPPTPAEQQGFGTMVIRRALNHAKVEHRLTPDGAYCLVELPV